MQRLRVFISSPGDVGQERLIAARVLDRLQGEFSHALALEPVLWEHEPLRATAHFQDEIPPPSACDIVICILWSRLGTRLPGHFRRPDGSEYASGTEWEFEDAAQSFLKRGAPDLLVYRKTLAPQTDLADEAEVLEKLRQKKALDAFLARWFGDAQSGFTNAFHAFQTPEQFEQLIEAHLRRLLRAKAEQAPDSDGPPLPARWRQGSPFRGLEAFSYEHAAVFFGRTRAVGELREALVERARRGAAFVLVLAASGSGKSSLLRAGLLPTICQPGVVEGVGLWRRCEVRPSDSAGDLFAAFAGALLGETAFPNLPAAGFDRAGLVRLLRDSPSGAIAAIRAGLAQESAAVAQRERLARAPEARLIVLVDQLEELFDQERIAPADAARFVGLIGELARSGVVWVVAAMRSDFYHRAAELPELLALSEGAGQRHLPPADFAEIGQMIRLPARAAGLRFETAPDGRRLDDVLHEAAARDPSALPLLSFALDELYKRRTSDGVLTFEAYEALGGLEGALARRAEEVFQSLAPDVQATLPEVLRALVSVGREQGEPATARRAPLEVVAAGPARAALIDAFVDARLLVADRDERGATVRFAHEALLRRWPRLAAWLEEDREFLRVSARIADAERRWRDEGAAPEFLLPEGKPLSEAADLLRRRRADLASTTIEYVEASLAAVEARHRAAAAEQRHRLQRTRLAAAAFAVIAALAGGAGWYGLTERRHAQEQREVAIARAAEATAASAEAKRQAEAALREQRRADAARRAADVARLRAETQGRAALQAQSLFLADASRRAAAEGDLETALLLALEALPDAEQDPPRPYVPQAEAALYEAVAEVRSEVVLQGFDAPVTALAWSPDGARLAGVSADGELRVWLPAGAPKPVLRAQAHLARATAVAFHPDGRHFATAAADGSLKLWDAATGKARELQAGGAAILGLGFSPDGRRLATAGWDGARLWDAASWTALSRLATPGDRLTRVAFSPDGRQLLALGWSGAQWRWDANGKRLSGAAAPTAPDSGEAGVPSPDGKLVALPTPEGDVRVRASAPIRAAAGFQAHEARISRLAMSPDGTLFATAAWDGEAKLWSLPDGRPLATLRGDAGRLHDAAFSPDSRLLATASRDGAVRLWRASTGALVAVLHGPGDDVRDLAFSPDGRLLATASDDGCVRLFEVESARLLHELPLDREGARRVAFSRDGSRLVGAGIGGVVQVWSVDGALLTRLKGLRGAATQAAFDAAGEAVVAAGTDGQTLVWRVSDGDLIAELDRHESAVWHIAFSPDGERLLTASTEGAIHVWSARTWRLLATSAGTGAAVEQAVFTPDGDRILTAGADGAARLIDAASGEQLARLVAHSRALTDLAVAPDGAHVIAAAADGQVWIAPIFPSTEALVRYARGLVSRELSPLERRRFFLGGLR